MQRTIVVGDLHGCIDELRELLKAAGYRRGDRLACVGDLVSKGPDSQAVVQLLREEGGLAVLGNHDDHALKARVQHEHGHAVKPERQKLLDTLRGEDWAFLAALPLFVRLGSERKGEAHTVVVHGGVVPGIPLEKQDREHLLTLRSIRDDGTPSKKIEGTPWAALWRGPERIVFGHDAVRGLQQHALATGLDTGCVYGGKLTGIVLPERELISVKARHRYAPW
jgi:predicted phosphodiesterase